MRVHCILMLEGGERKPAFFHGARCASRQKPDLLAASATGYAILILVRRTKSGPRRARETSDKGYAWGDVVLPPVVGGQGVPGDGVIPGDELVLP
jgi:hypothetical protein